MAILSTLVHEKDLADVIPLCWVDVFKATIGEAAAEDIVSLLSVVRAWGPRAGMTVKEVSKNQQQGACRHLRLAGGDLRIRKSFLPSVCISAHQNQHLLQRKNLRMRLTLCPQKVIRLREHDAS